MSIDPNLLSFVKEEESFSPKAFWDFHQWSIGYGTKAHNHNEIISQAEAERRLVIELEAAQAAVVNFQGTMPDGIRNALTDLTFNAGAMWMHMGLGDEVKAQDWKQAKAHLLMYDRAGGKINPGLAARRQKEASWFPEL